ncbi:VanZ family protein [Halopenitus persicus]|uniref:VanZ family protein n=1 Tax=Halopenitus persicus TaxID=1048396 RepID=UPI000BBAB98E|nr:VanZ family protein [Halopenitus persicus]
MTRRRLRLPLLPTRLRLGAAVLVAGIILYYSVFAPPGAGTIERGPFGLVPYSTWLHGLAYTGLGGSIGYALVGSASTVRRRVGMWIGTVGYGVAIELVQSQLPARTFAVADMGVNALGASLALVVWIALDRYVRFVAIRSATAVGDRAD